MLGTGPTDEPDASASGTANRLFGHQPQGTRMRALIKHRLQAVLQVAPHADMGVISGACVGRESGRRTRHRQKHGCTDHCALAHHITCKDPADLWSERAGYVTQRSSHVHTASDSAGIASKIHILGFFLLLHGAGLGWIWKA